MTAVQLTGGAGSVSLAASDLGIETTWPIDAAPTLRLAVHDPARELVNHAILDDAHLDLDKVRWQLTDVAKSGSTLNLTFEPAHATALRGQEGELTAKAGTVSRARFVARLAGDVDVPVVVLEDDGDTSEQYTRGEDETSWDAMRRHADEAGWRGFLTPDGLVFASDTHLIDLRDPIELSEFTAGVDVINFTVAAGAPVETASLNVRSDDPDSIRPGDPVRVAELRPMRGLWLVSTVTRSRYRAGTSIGLVRRGSAGQAGG